MTNEKTAKVSEIFDSIQGEGPYIGYRQLFIRFCGCNLLCDYCDTEFDKGDVFTLTQLTDKVKSYDLEHIHSVSLTGGEPLLHYEFLKSFLPELKKLGVRIYLETNGTMTKALEQVIDFVDIVSMDFKVDSSAKIGDLYSKHDDFLKVVKDSKKEVFAKLVFDETIRDFEINECVKLAQKYDLPIILQPKMGKNGNSNEIAVSHDKIIETFNKFTEKYHDTRMIGQVHKFFGII